MSKSASLKSCEHRRFCTKEAFFSLISKNTRLTFDRAVRLGDSVRWVAWDDRELCAVWVAFCKLSGGEICLRLDELGGRKILEKINPIN